jgi:fructokinase
VEIELAAEAGDEQAQQAFERYEDRMARGLAMIVDILDPDAIVIGGGLSKVDRIYAGVRAKLGDYCFGGGAETPVLRAMHGDSSGVRGAAWLWKNGE